MMIPLSLANCNGSQIQTLNAFLANLIISKITKNTGLGMKIDGFKSQLLVGPTQNYKLENNFLFLI